VIFYGFTAVKYHLFKNARDSVKTRCGLVFLQAVASMIFM